MRQGEAPGVHPSLRLLQRMVPGFHVGGKTALNWYGVRHYVAQQETLHLYGSVAAKLPAWFVERRTNLPSSTPPQPQPRQPSTQPTHLSKRPGTSNSFVDEHHSTRSIRLKQAASGKFSPRLRARPSR